MEHDLEHLFLLPLPSECRITGMGDHSQSKCTGNRTQDFLNAKQVPEHSSKFTVAHLAIVGTDSASHWATLPI